MDTYWLCQPAVTPILFSIGGLRDTFTFTAYIPRFTNRKEYFLRELKLSDTVRLTGRIDRLGQLLQGNTTYLKVLKNIGFILALKDEAFSSIIRKSDTYK